PRRTLRAPPRPRPPALPPARHRPPPPHLRGRLLHRGRPRGLLAHRNRRGTHRPLGTAGPPRPSSVTTGAKDLHPHSAQVPDAFKTTVISSCWLDRTPGHATGERATGC